MQFLFTLCLILLFTKLAGQLCQTINLPSVTGELMVGILLGPAILNWIQPDQFVHYFSEIGVIVLMFIAGLESDLALLKKYFLPAIAVASAGIILPIVGIYYASRFFAFSATESIFLGVIFCATSVSISVQVLKELHYLDTKEGTTILGAAVVDDIGGILILGIMISILGINDSSQKSEPIWWMILSKILFFIAILAVSKWVVPRILKLSSKFTMQEAISTMGLVICLGFAFFADLAGLGGIIGAFIAGVAIAQTDQQKIIETKISPIGYAVFIPVFFASIGLQMEFHGLMKNIGFLLTITLIAIFTKLLGGVIGAKLTGFSTAEGKIIGAGMVSRGEMGLVIAQIGLNAKLLSQNIYSEVIVAIIATTVIAPFILKYYVNKKLKA